MNSDVYNLRWLEWHRCPIPMLLCRHRFSQRQCHFDHIHHRCSPIRPTLFAISSDPYRLILNGTISLGIGIVRNNKNYYMHCKRLSWSIIFALLFTTRNAITFDMFSIPKPSIFPPFSIIIRWNRTDFHIQKEKKKFLAVPHPPSRPIKQKLQTLVEYLISTYW